MDGRDFPVPRNASTCVNQARISSPTHRPRIAVFTRTLRYVSGTKAAIKVPISLISLPSYTAEERSKNLESEMVNFTLEITAELENLTSLQPQGGPDNPNFGYLFKLKCGNCGEVTQKETCVTMSETVSIPNGKGTVNLVQKCKFCGREGTVQMAGGHGDPLTHGAAEAGKYIPLMVFDCRGMEPVEFFFGNGWEAYALSGTKFIEIDLSDGEFAEYDEEGKYPVGISNVQSRFVVGKPKGKPRPW